jgi:hypothetical protein
VGHTGYIRLKATFGVSIAFNRDSVPFSWPNNPTNSRGQTPYSWGHNAYDATNTPSGYYCFISRINNNVRCKQSNRLTDWTVVINAQDSQEISAGYTYFSALKTNGTVFTWAGGDFVATQHPELRSIRQLVSPVRGTWSTQFNHYALTGTGVILGFNGGENQASIIDIHE